jgi:hypothetical protein
MGKGNSTLVILPVCNRFSRFFISLFCLVTRFWLNSLVADLHFWSKMRKLEAKKRKEKKRAQCSSLYKVCLDFKLGYPKKNKKTKGIL